MRHTRLYRQGELEAKDFPAAQISDYLQQPDTVVWLDLCEPDQVDLEVISQEFGLHPLAVEDATQQHERPKLDRYQDHYFLTAYAVSLDHDTGTLTTSELAAFATPPGAHHRPQGSSVRHRGGGGPLGRLGRPGRS